MKLNIKTIAAVAVLVALLSLFAAPVPAEEKPADTMELLVQKLKADKKLLIAETMQFSEPEAGKFWPVYDSYQAELDKLVHRLMVIILDYADQYKMLSDQKAMGILDEYLAIESERLALRKAYLPKFRQALPDKKVVRFYQLENKIQAAVNYELAANIPLVK